MIWERNAVLNSLIDVATGGGRVKRIQREGLSELVAWMDERKTKYYKIGWAYLQNQFDIEDVFHNTVLLAHEKKHQLREERYFETWVTRIFINECKRMLKQRNRYAYSPVEDHVGVTYTNDTVEVLEHLEQVDDIYRDVIILKYVSGYSQEEIAAMLDIAVGTVKSRIGRGFKQLREIMAKGGK